MKLCYECMTEVKEEAYICPVCAKKIDNNKKEVKDLPPGVILQGRYIVGKSQNIDDMFIRYSGLDIKEAQRIDIIEYYPDAYIKCRQPEGTVDLKSQMENKFYYGLDVFYLDNLKLMGEESQKWSKKVAVAKDLFHENGTGYAIFSFSKDRSLKEYLEDRGGKLEYDEALCIIQKILNVLVDLHENGMFHGDIIPENIRLSADGNVLLINLGQVRNVIQKDFGCLLENERQKYKALEEFSQEETIGSWTDIYRVGALFYQLITGTDIPASWDRFQEDTLICPSKLGVKIPKEEELILLKSLNIQKKDRFDNATEFLNSYFYLYEWKKAMKIQKCARIKEIVKKSRIVLILLSFFLVVFLSIRKNITEQEKIWQNIEWRKGEIVRLGRYEQDGNRLNGKEDIEWRILAKEEDRVLLLTEKILDCQPYHNRKMEITWADCDLRKWLNETFYKKAFTARERKRLESVLLKNDDNPDHGTDGGEDTEDKIFLLSYEEAMEYLLPPDDIYASATEEVKMINEKVVHEDGRSWWRLRTPGIDKMRTCIAGRNGTIHFSEGAFVYSKNGGNRIAMWVKI